MFHRFAGPHLGPIRQTLEALRVAPVLGCFRPQPYRQEHRSLTPPLLIPAHLEQRALLAQPVRPPYAYLAVACLQQTLRPLLQVPRHQPVRAMVRQLPLLPETLVLL